MWGLDAARRERGASATEGRGGGGGSPGLQVLSPKAGDTPAAGKALVLKCRGALQGPRISRPWRSAGGREDWPREVRGDGHRFADTGPTAWRPSSAQ